MKIERTKNASRNMLFGFALKIYQLFMPFLMRTIMIYYMGVGYLGLNSLFVSILQVLNLAELGVGNAMVYSMYKPIVEDDKQKICALMQMYKLYYRVIGVIIAVVGCLLTPFIHSLIKSDLPMGINIYILYLLNLAATVLSYWLFAYKNSLLLAHQRTDVGNSVTLITSMVQYILQAVVLILLHDYYIYIVITLAVQACNNVITAVCADKMYPDYKPKGKLSKTEIQNINGRIRDLFTSKIGAVVVNSADTIVISAFIGLTVLAMYQNYYYLITAVIGLVAVVFSSVSAGIGNSLITETKEKNFSDFKKFLFIISWIAGWCACCFLCLFQPFMEIWVGRELMLDFSIVILLCVYFFVYEVNTLMNVYKDAAGMWHEDRFRPLVTAGTNLLMNLVMVQFWGLYGIILSTLISTLLVGMPWLTHNLFTVIFRRSSMKLFLKRVLYYAPVSFVVCAVTYYICNLFSMSPVMTVIVRLIICVVIPNILFIIVYHKLPEFSESLQLLKKMIQKK